MNISAAIRALPFYYGWVVVGATGATMFARTTASSAVLALFLVPMSTDLGWSRTLVVGAASLGGLTASALGPLIGRLADRYGPRVLLSVSMVLLGLSVASLGATASPITFYPAYVVGRTIFASPVPIAATVSAARWFRARRGLALGIAQSSSYLGLVVLPLLVQGIIGALSWRAAWVVLGAIALAITVAPALLLAPRRPEDLGLRPDGAADSNTGSAGPEIRPSDETGWTLRQAAATWSLWLLCLAGGFLFAVQAGVSVHQAAYFQAQGMSGLVAASVVSVMAAANLAGALISGSLCNRLGAKRLYALAALLMAADMFLLLTVRTPARAYLFALLLGLGIGSGATLGPVIFADAYGQRAIGAIRGVAEPFVSGGQAAGVLLAGIIFDLTGSYETAILIFAGLATMAAALIGLARPARLSAG